MSITRCAKHTFADVQTLEHQNGYVSRKVQCVICGKWKHMKMAVPR